MIGHSLLMRKALELINQVADTLSTILIRGESGTGKELVANAIHRKSRRVEGPFREGELRGAEREPAGERAVRARGGGVHGGDPPAAGAVRAGGRGTIFLDEVGELAATTQAKLLRVLQEREFERVGGTETIAVDVRVIAATNLDLEEGVGRGRFGATCTSG